MNEEKKWMLMTYYCPTHGDSGLVKPRKQSGLPKRYIRGL